MGIAAHVVIMGFIIFDDGSCVFNSSDRSSFNYYKADVGALISKMRNEKDLFYCLMNVYKVVSLLGHKFAYFSYWICH